MENEKKKSGYVSLIGRPNVGKSTLMNHLIGQKIAITSDKPQTTRKRIRTVYTDERGQIIFLDTPGMTRARNKLGEYMETVAERALKDVDLILWLVEPSSYIGAGDRQIASQLSAQKAPKLLVINKIDTISEEERKKVESTYRKLMDFADIIPVSALKAVNLDRLLAGIFKELPEGPMYYDEDTVTDETMRQIAAEIIREKTLRLLSDEVPHGIAVDIERMKERPDGIMDIDAAIICEKDSHKGIIIGKNGSMAKKIGSAARVDIEKMLEMKVNLKLFVKVRKDWRDNDMMLKSLGYNRKDL